MVIGWALDHRLAMVGLAVLSFVAALALPALGIVGGAFFPVQDVSEFTIAIEAPPGSNLEYTRIKAQEAARLARAKPEVAYTYATVGGRTGAVDEGTVFVRLVPKAERARRQELVSNEVRRELAALGGVTASIGTGRIEGGKQIQIELRGPETSELARLADLVAARGTPGDGRR